MPDTDTAAAGPADPAAAQETMLLTIFLRHDQTQDLVQQQDKLDAVDWWNGFPPEGCQVVSWVVAMGVGQIVTLRLPPRLLQVVNVELERRAWAYDFLDTRQRLVHEANERTGRA
jgi:hypothetical protein